MHRTDRAGGDQAREGWWKEGKKQVRIKWPLCIKVGQLQVVDAEVYCGASVLTQKIVGMCFMVTLDREMVERRFFKL